MLIFLIISFSGIYSISYLHSKVSLIRVRSYSGRLYNFSLSLYAGMNSTLKYPTTNLSNSS